MSTVIIEFKDETMVDRRGLLLNSHWSDAYGCWMCLLCCEDGPLRTIRSDALGLSSHWIPDDPAFIMYDDDDNEDFDEDNADE